MTPYYDDGQITIFHGDALEIDAWLGADVLVTDPPYGMAFRSGMGGIFGLCQVDGDQDTTARDLALSRWGAKPALVFGRWSIPRPAQTRMVLVWEKGTHVGMGDLSIPWKPNTEEIYVMGSGFAGHRGSSVLRSPAVAWRGTSSQVREHPTQKPVDLMRMLIEKCPPGVIADPFMGCGTTLRAAKDLGRRAIGVEIVERYCEAAAQRMGQEVFAV